MTDLSSPEEPCLDYICTQVGESCFESCSETCERNCNQYVQQCSASCSENLEQACSSMCQDACDQMCQNACSSSSSGIFSSFIKSCFLLAPIITTLFFAIIMGLFQSFDPKGPILLTIFGSCILSINLSGVRLTRRKFSCKGRLDGDSCSFSSKFRWITIHHSHHPRHLSVRGHEFKIGNKYFCTGCYGLFIGTLCAIILASLYFAFGLNKMWTVVILTLVPFFFIPIFLRYTVLSNMRTSMKLVANSLVPIGWALLSISLDVLLHNWAINVLMILIILFSAYLRSIIATKDNSQ